MNTQPIKKRVDNDPDILEVHSIFNTIQGEGPYSGKRAVFVRLEGCNLRCPGCDTDYSKPNSKTDVTTVLQNIRKYRSELVVITGGEPFRQNISRFCSLLLNHGYLVQIETNGTLPPPHDLDERVEVVCSPKTGKVNFNLLPYIVAYKYVIHADSVADDGLPVKALNHPANPQVARPHDGFQGGVYVQPMETLDPVVDLRNLQACVRSSKEFGYTLQIQLHKHIGVE